MKLERAVEEVKKLLVPVSTLIYCRFRRRRHRIRRGVNVSNFQQSKSLFSRLQAKNNKAEMQRFVSQKCMQKFVCPIIASRR